MEDTPAKEIPNIENWSENFAFAGYDPKAKIGVFLHMGRWRKDLSMWRHMVVISLPGDVFLVNRAVGNALASERGPGGPNLKMEVIKDQHHLVWSFLGGARRLTGDFLKNSLPIDGPLERLEFSLDFQSDLPLWHLGAGGVTAFAGHGHTEQIGRTVGEVKIGDTTIAIDTYFNRDHSRGPRLGKQDFIRHNWFQGIFENGLRFYAYEAHETDDVVPNFSRAAVVSDGVMYPATVTINPYLPQQNGMDHIHDPVSFRFEYEGGVLEGVTTSFPSTSHQSSTAPWEPYLGVKQVGDKPVRRLIEQSVLYQLKDGTPGFGHWERFVPGWLLHDEELG